MRKRDYMIPGALFFLGLLPILTGTMTVIEVKTLIDSGEPAGDYYTYVSYPWIIISHIIFGSVFNLLGPFQFVPVIRRRWPRMHRMMGRIFIISGLLTVLGAIWMNQFFPAYGGILKYTSILIFGIAMLATMFIAVRAILRRDIVMHRKWMIRTFAIGLGVSVQRLILLPYFAMFGIPEGNILGAQLWMGWLISIAVGEWWIRRTEDTPVAYGLVR